MVFKCSYQSPSYYKLKFDAIKSYIRDEKGNNADTIWNDMILRHT